MADRTLAHLVWTDVLFVLTVVLLMSVLSGEAH